MVKQSGQVCRVVCAGVHIACCFWKQPTLTVGSGPHKSRITIRDAPKSKHRWFKVCVASVLNSVTFVMLPLFEE